MRLRNGPEVGVHTIVWCDTVTNLNRTLERRLLREFALRVAFQMSAEDSSTLLDSPAASKVGPNRAYLYSEDEGRLEKFRADLHHEAPARELYVFHTSREALDVREQGLSLLQFTSTSLEDRMMPSFVRRFA
ncbi:MAG: hypothetical protein WAU00_07920 [Caldilinea sp.]|uniref:hypothetical protein n=1 Tax=Caldilinea sp. TaxID=2293560 RepID=UPI002D0C0BDC|nr:hypothetical protein [Anaerolineales bacterium]HQY94522.1 hypothetical protein [Caldilinea sp.]HRA68009.1 hypothetical protein [Caldilinea sp.]